MVVTVALGSGSEVSDQRASSSVVLSAQFDSWNMGNMPQEALQRELRAHLKFRRNIAGPKLNSSARPAPPSVGRMQSIQFQ